MLASLVLHALILQLLPVLREARPARPAPPITAQLVTPVLPKPAPPEPPKVEPPPQAAQPAARPQPRPAPAPILAIEPVNPAAEAPAFSVPPAPPSPPPVSQPAPAAPVARLEAAPAASGPDPGTIARFRLELMEVAGRYKRYPRIAQDNNWEGRVELRITFSEAGAISAMTVKKSAGRTVLDDEAQAMLRSAQAQISVPPALRGRAFVLEIPVNFALKDAR